MLPMKVAAAITLPTESKVWIVDKVFPESMIDQINDCFNTYIGQSGRAWEKTANFAPQRLVYQGVHPVIDQINKYGDMFLVNEVSRIIKKKVRFVYPSLWIDLPGYELHPHNDVDNFDYAVQVYMGSDYLSKNLFGTSVYQDYDTPLFDICYRQNSGYLFDSTATVLHGIRQPVPEGSMRRSVYLRYTSQI